MQLKLENHNERIRINFENRKEFEDLIDFFSGIRKASIDYHVSKGYDCCIDVIVSQIESSFMETEYKGKKQFSSVIWESQFIDLFFAFYEAVGLSYHYFNHPALEDKK